MRTIQQRNLDRLSRTLNDGLSRLNELWGHGCPIGMDPLSLADIHMSDEEWLGIHRYKKGVTTFRGDISRFLYDSNSIKPKLDWWTPTIKEVKRIQVMTHYFDKHIK